MTAVEPTDEDGWIIEVEIVEDRRIPSAADILALYEIELGPDGDLLGYWRPVVTGAQKAWHSVPIRRIRSRQRRCATQALAASDPMHRPSPGATVGRMEHTSNLTFDHALTRYPGYPDWR